MTQGDRELIERFKGWSNQSVIAECRGQARGNLDPEYNAFMNETADRLEALLAEKERLRDSLTGLTPENLKAIPEWMSDFHILPLDVTAGELRRAFQALKGANNG